MNVNYRFVYDRKNEVKKGLKHKALLQIELSQGRKKKYISTGRYLTSSQWDTQRLKVCKHYLADEINESLVKLMKKIEKANAREGATIESVADFLKSNKDFVSFTDFMRHEIDYDSIAPSTKKLRLSVLNHIETFGIKYFSDINIGKIEEFDIYLRNHPNIHEQATVNTKHKTLSNYINRAKRKGYIEVNPYENFTMRKIKRKIPVHLSEEQLKTLEEKKMPVVRLQEVADTFIFQCYTGMHYVDVAEFNPKKHIIDVKGAEWISKHRVKTGELFELPLLEKAKAILDKYEGKLPVITNQKTNAYLKEIAGLCDFDMNLTNKVARNTFATTVTLLHGVNLKAVSAMLGHSSIKSTEIYSEATRQMIENEMQKLK